MIHEHIQSLVGKIIKGLSLSIMVMVVSFTSSAQPGDALDFDGSDDHVGGMNINQHVNNKITVSAWIKPSGFTSSDFQGIVTEEYDPSNTNVVFELFYDGNKDKFGAGFYKNGSWTKVFDANTYTTTGEWIFLAATYDGNDLKFYLNGNQVNSVRATRGLPSGDHNWRIGSRHDFFNNSSNYFNGKIDEVRIWSEARTQQEIRNLMHQEIKNPGSKTNLEAYYDFNSSSGTTLTDQAGSNDGTLKNMTTSGSGSDWVNSRAALTDNAKVEQGNTFHNDVRGIWPAKTTESSDGLTVSESSSALSTQDNVVFGHDGANNQNTNPNNSNYDFTNVSASSIDAVAKREWFIDENAGGKNIDLTFNTNDAGIGNLPSGGNKDDYVLIEVKSSGKDELIKTANSINASNNTISFNNVNINSTYKFGTTSSGSAFQPGNALDFDGSDDYVGGMNINPHVNNKITVSAWIKPSGFTNNQFQGIVTEEYDPNATDVVFELFYDGLKDKFGAGFYRDSSWTKVFDANTYTTTGEWIFLAATYDGNDLKFYLNGNQVNSVRATRGLPSGDHNWRIGSRHDHFNNNFTVPSNYFNGSIDEVRIWSEARTQQQIKNLMHKELNASNYSSLEAYYRLNGSNQTVTDQTVNNNGTLGATNSSNSDDPTRTSSSGPLSGISKFSGSGTFSNDVEGIWPSSTSVTSGGLTISENSNNTLSAGDDVVVGHNNNANQNTNSNISNYDFTNVSASSIDAVAKREWFIDENAGGKNIDLTFNTNDAGIGSLPSGSNAGDYVLIEVKSSGKDVLIKTANSISSSNNTISFDNVDIKNTYTFGTTSSGSPLPVELTHFTVQQEGSRSARLEWATASETNNKHFLVQRRQEDQWQQVGRVKGHGTTIEPQEYGFTDNGLTSGTHYYRLKQVDFDGSYEYSDVKAIAFEGAQQAATPQLSLHPNPVADQLNVEFSGSTENTTYQVQIHSSRGEVVYREAVAVQQGGLSRKLPVSALPPGAYVLMLQGAEQTHHKRFIKQ